MASININKKRLSNLIFIVVDKIRFMQKFLPKFKFNIDHKVCFLFHLRFNWKRIPSFSGHKYNWDVTGFRFTFNIRFDIFYFFCVVCEQFTLSMRGWGEETWINFTNCIWISSTCERIEIAENCIYRKSKCSPFHTS